MVEIEMSNVESPGLGRWTEPEEVELDQMVEMVKVHHIQWVYLNHDQVVHDTSLIEYELEYGQNMVGIWFDQVSYDLAG